MSLNIENLYKTYGKKNVLNDISVNFQAEKIYGLLGNNGAGKSTLLNIINNRIFDTKGKITLDGRLVTENEKSLNNIHLMSEDDLYPSKLKIKSLFHLMENFYGDFDWKLANEMLSEFELEPTKRMSKLSTGYRSIAKLIIALCVPCEYIFLDEPVLGLDANHRELFYNYLIETYQENPRTFVISTHLIEEISNILEKVIILDKGKIIEDDSVENILENTYIVTGSIEEVEAFTDQLQILEKTTLGGSLTAFVKGELPQNKMGNIKVESMSLQDYFMKIASKKKGN